MKYILLVLALAAVCIARPQVTQEARDKFAALDVNALLADKTKVEALLKCAVDEGPCDDGGDRLKNFMSTGFKKGCPDCTDDEKTKVKQIVDGIKSGFPEYYQKILTKFNDGKEPTPL